MFLLFHIYAYNGVLFWHLPLSLKEREHTQILVVYVSKSTLDDFGRHSNMFFKGYPLEAKTAQKN